MSEELKLCIACTYFDDSRYRCQKKQTLRKSLVTGEWVEDASSTRCSTERASNHLSDCGPEAKFFVARPKEEPRKTLWQRMREWKQRRNGK